MENTEIHVVPNILMLVGLASIGTNWMAGRVCQDSLDPSRFPRWKVFLLGWYAVAALICCLLVAVVVLSYALQGRLEESLKVGSYIRLDRFLLLLLFFLRRGSHFHPCRSMAQNNPL